VIGGVLWGAGVTLLGAVLGQFSVVRDNIDAILIGIVLLSVTPIAIEYLRARRKKSREQAQADGPSGAAPSADAPAGGGAPKAPEAPASPENGGQRGRHARR
jgi:membrane-associated protein